MKHILSLFACIAICCTMMVSCKNVKTTETAAEEIQQQKQSLADSVLVEIDSLAELLINADSKTFKLKDLELTEAEKMVKPDYLLDLAVANTLVTKSQKINALAIYVVDAGIKKLYDMPCEEDNEVIAKLAAEVNYPLDMDATFDVPVSERIKREYEACRERDDLASFWQFHYAAMNEVDYVVAHITELFFSKITDEQWQAFRVKYRTELKAVGELAQYDEEMALLWKLRNQYRLTKSDEERVRVNQTIESAKQFRIANKEKYIARRNALLQ